MLASRGTPEGEAVRLWAVESLDLVPSDCPETLGGLPDGGGIQARFLAPDDPVELREGFALLRKPGPLAGPHGEIVPRDDLPDPGRATHMDPSVQLGMPLRAFGVEDRVQVSGHAEGIRIRCAAGRRPAGAVLKVGPLRLPVGQRLRMRLSYTTDKEFDVLVSDPARSRAGDPLPWLQLEPGSRQMMAEFPLGGLERGSLQDVTFSCPSRAVQLAIKDLRIEPIARPRAAPARSLWLWDSDRWRQEGAAVVAEAVAAGADTLFVSVPVDLAQEAVESPRALAAFVRLAGQSRVAVFAVTGDPRAVLEKERRWFAARARAYGRYNASVAPQERLAGLQLDIEPWIGTSYGVDPQRWNQAYLQTVSEVKAASHLPLDLAVPFWWDKARVSPATTLLDALAPLVDSLTVMNYRTREPLILGSAQPFLDWSLRHGRRVRIALEAGPIDDAVLWHLRPAQRGEVAIVQLAGHAIMLSLAQATRIAGAVMYRASHSTPFSGERTTFRGREAQLIELVRGLERGWSAWPGFAGVALHGYRPRQDAAIHPEALLHLSR